MPFGSSEIRENQYSEGRKGVYELVAALLTFVFRFARKSAQGPPPLPFLCALFKLHLQVLQHFDSQQRLVGVRVV